MQWPDGGIIDPAAGSKPVVMSPPHFRMSTDATMGPDLAEGVFGEIIVFLSVCRGDRVSDDSDFSTIKSILQTGWVRKELEF